MWENPRKINRYGSPVAYCADIDETVTYEEAVSGPNGDKWQKAVDEEPAALGKNETWRKCDLLPGRKAITAKFVFKIKKTPSGDVERYKARLVARGFSQRAGLDYGETWSPVVRYEAIRVLLALTAVLDLEMVEFDIKTAFLNGFIEEDIYMELPPTPNTGTIVKLQRSLYGIKQAPRAWNRRFVDFLSKYKFVPNSADPCVFKGEFENEMVLLALFMDDGLLLSKSKEVLERVVVTLKSEFEVTVGTGEYFVGIEITRNCAACTIKITQKSYLLQVAKKFGMSEAHGASTPIDPNFT